MEKDLTKKSCLSDNERYADLINGLIFQGRQLLCAEDLSEMDSQTGMWGKTFRRGKRQRGQKYRDLVKKAAKQEKVKGTGAEGLGISRDG